MNQKTGAVLVAGCLAIAVGCHKASETPRQPHDEFQERGLRLHWRAQLPLEPGETVLATQRIAETLFCVTNHATVFALDAHAGVITWSRRLGSMGDRVFPPTISFGSGLDDAVVLTSQAGVWVVERRTGKLITRADLPFGPAGSAVASDELIWAGGMDGMMHANFSDGFHHWRFKTGSAITAAPILLPDRIVFGSRDHHVYCATPISKERLWVFDADGPVTATPAYRDGLIFVPSHSRRLFCLDVDTGELVWQHQTPEPLTASPRVTDDTVYQFCGDAGLLAVDRDTGAERWTLPDATAFVAQHGGTAYVADRFGNLLEVDNATGSVRWTFFVRDLDLAAANVEDSAIHFLSRDGRMTCLERLQVPYLRSGDIKAALRAGSSGG